MPEMNNKLDEMKKQAVPSGGSTDKTTNQPEKGNGQTRETNAGSNQSHQKTGIAAAPGQSASGSIMEQAKATAGGVYDAVADKASAALEDKKSDLTGGLTSVADTVRRVGGAITEGETKNGVTDQAAKYTETVANKLEDVASYFNHADLKGVARDIESYARRNPAVFLGAAFALGVLAARFIKSSPTPATKTGASVSPKSVNEGRRFDTENRESASASI